MASYSAVCKDVREMFSRSVRRRYNIIRQTKYSTSSAENSEKLLIRNVFQDNPTAKYWLLGGLTVTGGTTYYVYNNQRKKKLVLNILPPHPSHYCFPRDDEVEHLKVLLEGTKSTRYPKEVQILGPPGSGKTQLARMLAERLNQSRRESFLFKLWPKDEVTAYLHAHSKTSLLLGLKQLAVKLGCSEDEIKSDQIDVNSQLNVVSQVVQNKLKQKSHWVLLIDHYDKYLSELTKWLPDSNWGNGYVIHTSLSQNNGDSEKENKIPNYNINQMTDESAKKLFQGVVNESKEQNEHFPENLLKLLQYNPLSLVYAAVFFKYKIELNNKYSYHDLFCDLENTFHDLNAANTGTNGLLNIQTSCVTLAAKAMSELSPKLIHVFDFLGSCNPSHAIPVDILLCHLKISEFHIQVEPDIDVAQPNEDDASSSIKVSTDLEGEQNVWSLHGIVAQAIRVSERIKLEVDALKSLFGYGGGLFGTEIQPPEDGLEFVRSCPLLIRSSEPSADVEVLSTHPIVNNVFRQLFLNVTIPLLERQHLIIAERKHQQKSYFARLQRFDSQKVICEYRKCLGDNVSIEERENHLPTVRGTPSIGTILSGSNTTDKGSDEAMLKHPNIIGHVQEHFNRVVGSFSNYYRMAGSGRSAMVARALLLPHLETLLHEHQLTAASKGQIYQTMARVHSNILGDLTTGKRLLSEAFVVYQQHHGENSVQIAHLMEQQAELLSMSEELQQSKALLERALSIYQKDKKANQTSKYSINYGKTLIALGVVYGSLGESVRSKDMLEKGLMELQNAAPDNPHAKENKWFAAEISSAVTSLGHAYLSLGNINQGRKLLELALIGHQNVHGDSHSEVIRALTTLSIAHAMQGNAQESKRLRNEAGKIKKKLNMRTPLFLA